jgi:adenylate kinase
MNSPQQSSQIVTIKPWLAAGSIDLFGYPFAGKDTHGNDLATLFDAPLLGGGQILRNPTMSQRIKDLMSTGQLLPTKDYLEIVLPYLSKAEFSGRPLILSSVGRWHGEEAGVLEATAEAQHPLRAVIFLDINEEEVWRRWKSDDATLNRGVRNDDAEDKLVVRLSEFRSKTLPVVNFYREQGLLIEVDGMPAPSIVLRDIINKLYRLSMQQQ